MSDFGQGTSDLPFRGERISLAEPTCPPPSILDYELLRRIGAGSYGEVWLARNALGSLRAVKIVYRKSFDHDKPYEREFEGLKKFEPISHARESQIDIFHVGRNDAAGFFYYVMELADEAEPVPTEVARDVPIALRRAEDSPPYQPRTLKHDLRTRGALPVAECVTIALSLTRALEHLHAHGLVHRDIKPSNIIFVNGVPKLADIGLVTSIDATRSFVGTDGYIPPEGPGSPSADLYSLGKVLYEMVTGKDRLDFPELPTDWRTRPDFEQLLEFNEILTKACDAEPKQRYQFAEEMRADLEVLKRGQSVKRLHKLERTTVRLKRFGIATAVMMILGFSTTLFLGNQARRFKEFADESNQRLVRAHVVSGLRLMEEGELYASLPWFVEALNADQGDAQHEAIHRYRIEAILRQCPKLVQVGVHDGALRSAEFSPDGLRVVTASDDHTARVWDASTGKTTTPPLQHDDTVRWAGFSPDGLRVLTASYDGTARVWDATTGAPLLSALRHDDGVFIAAFSPDGKRIVTGSEDKTARLWDAKTGQLTGPPLRHEGAIRAVAFNPDSQFVVSAGNDNTARIWRVATGELATPPLKHANSVRTAVFSPDGRRVLTASLDGTARIWDAGTGKPLIAPMMHAGELHFAAFNRDGSRVVTAAAAGVNMGEARVWDAITGLPIGPALRHKGRVLHADFSPDNNLLATASVDQTARVWEISTGKPISPAFQHGHEVRRAQFSPDGARILTCSRDATWRLWELASEASAQPPGLYSSAVRHVEFSADGSRTITASDTSVRLRPAYKPRSRGRESAHYFRVEDQRRLTSATTVQGNQSRGLATRDFSPGQPESDWEMAADNSADGCCGTFDPHDHFVAVKIEKFSVQILDSHTLQPVSPLIKHANRVSSAEFSPDGRWIATASQDQTARVWDVPTGEPVTPPMQHLHEVFWVTFSPDSKRIVTVSHDRKEKSQVRVWNAQTGEPVTRPIEPAGMVVHAFFSPDGRWVLTSSKDESQRPFGAQIWDATTGEPVGRPFPHRDGVVDAEFSPDGQRVVTASEDKTARVWDAKTSTPIGRPMQHHLTVHRARFSPDGQRVITASGDGSARIWDANTGDPISPPLRFNDPVLDAAFSPDGNAIIAGGGIIIKSGEDRLWLLPKTQLPAPDLVQLAQVLSGSRIDPTGEAVPLDAPALLSSYQAIREKYPEFFTNSLAGRFGWHQDQAHNAVFSHQRETMIFHTQKMRALAPDNPMTPHFEELIRREFPDQEKKPE